LLLSLLNAFLFSGCFSVFSIGLNRREKLF
jgi:hypothetical protein